jgi:pimeloyl-ACP methyl ester carboxylesterase
LGSGWFGIDVELVVALSVKVKWTNDEIQKGKVIGQNPIRWMATREEALDRYLRVSGLKGQKADMTRSANAGIVEEDGQFRVAADPKTFGCASLGVTSLLNQTRCPVVLVTGRNDPIAPPADFEAEGLPVSVLEGAGHQLHIEASAQVWQSFLHMRFVEHVDFPAVAFANE